MKNIDYSAICTDDYGTQVFNCHFTSRHVWADECITVGAIVPGVKAKYVMSPSDSAKLARRESGMLFHEAERNCNTCQHLERVPSAKNAGFLYGRCKSQSTQSEASPYADRQIGDVMAFHPDDPMHMPCYVSRWSA